MLEYNRILINFYLVKFSDNKHYRINKNVGYSFNSVIEYIISENFDSHDDGDVSDHLSILMYTKLMHTKPYSIVRYLLKYEIIFVNNYTIELVLRKMNHDDRERQFIPLKYEKLFRKYLNKCLIN